MGKKILHMIIVLGLTGLLSGLSLAFVYRYCENRIKQNEKDQIQQALKQVLPQAATFQPKGEGDNAYYEALDENENLVGYAKPSIGKGYQGKIQVIFGINDSLENLTGLVVFPNDETPGLGARIRDEDFRRQFDDLQPYPSVNYVKGAEPENPNEIQAITGATISSRAVVSIVNAGLEDLLWQVGETHPERASEFSALTGASQPNWIQNGERE